MSWLRRLLNKHHDDRFYANGPYSILIERNIGGIDFRIASKHIQSISEKEIDRIIHVVFDALVNQSSGWHVAYRIVTESTDSNVIAALVYGGRKGKNWEIILSDDPFELLD